MSYVPSVAERLTDGQRALVAQNQGLVWFVVNQMTNMPGDEDAFAAGVCGLAKAARNYNPEMGFAFSTHAVPWIRGAIQNDLDDHLHPTKAGKTAYSAWLTEQVGALCG